MRALVCPEAHLRMMSMSAGNGVQSLLQHAKLINVHALSNTQRTTASCQENTSSEVQSNQHHCNLIGAGAERRSGDAKANRADSRSLLPSQLASGLLCFLQFCKTPSTLCLNFTISCDSCRGRVVGKGTSLSVVGAQRPACSLKRHPLTFPAEHQQIRSLDLVRRQVNKQYSDSLKKRQIIPLAAFTCRHSVLAACVIRGRSSAKSLPCQR